MKRCNALVALPLARQAGEHRVERGGPPGVLRRENPSHRISRNVTFVKIYGIYKTTWQYSCSWCSVTHRPLIGAGTG